MRTSSLRFQPSTVTTLTVGAVRGQEDELFLIWSSSFPLPFLVLNRVFYLTNFDYSYIMGKENLEKE